MTTEKIDILALLKEKGVSLSAAQLNDAKAQLRAVSKALTDEKSAEFEERRDSNKQEMTDLAKRIRQDLEDSARGFLEGTTLNFTVRIEKGTGKCIATANDCHAAKVVESVHVDADGVVCYGQEGAKQAKNVRERKNKN